MTNILNELNHGKPSTKVAVSIRCWFARRSRNALWLLLVTPSANASLVIVSLLFWTYLLMPDARFSFGAGSLGGVAFGFVILVTYPIMCGSLLLCI